MRSEFSRIARKTAAAACLAAYVTVAAGGALQLTGCGSPNHTIPAPSPASAGSRFAGVYSGTWTFSAGLAPDAPATFGGPMSLTIDRNGNIAAVFTDIVGAGAGTFSAAGAVDDTGTITYVSPSPNLVGARTFSGVADIKANGSLAAAGTVFFDYPGTSFWSATAGAHS